jgi:hypothetical protein
VSETSHSSVYLLRGSWNKTYPGTGPQDLRGPDLRDSAGQCRGLSDAERNGKFAQAGLGMDTEGSVTFGVQDGYTGGIEGGPRSGVPLR